MGGGRRAHAAPAARVEQLRLAGVGGPLALYPGSDPERARGARVPDRHLQARERELLDHRRLRLPRQGRPGGEGALLLRRLPIWEEVDVRTPRQQRVLNNYGWRVWEGRSRYTQGQTPNARGELVFPIVTYKHANGNCSITGGYVYRGKAVPAAKGRYFYGDYRSGRRSTCARRASSAC